MEVGALLLLYLSLPYPMQSVIYAYLRTMQVQENQPQAIREGLSQATVFINVVVKIMRSEAANLDSPGLCTCAAPLCSLGGPFVLSLAP